MKHRVPPALLRGLAVVLVFLTGCQTLQYRQVQNDFQQAVEADNTGGQSPYIDWYQGVTEDLTDSYISNLPEKLRPNAWMLRGVSEWRSKQYDDAYKSADQGEAVIGRLAASEAKWAHSRDAVILVMLPALVQDSQLREQFTGDGRKISLIKYETNYFPAFRSIAGQLADAREKCGAETPLSVVDFWAYHTWRILQDWRITISEGLDFEAAKPARAQAHMVITNTVLGERYPGTADLNGMINAVSNGIMTKELYGPIMERETKRSQ